VVLKDIGSHDSDNAGDSDSDCEVRETVITATPKGKPTRKVKEAGKPVKSKADSAETPVKKRGAKKVKGRKSKKHDSPERPEEDADDSDFEPGEAVLSPIAKRKRHGKRSKGEAASNTTRPRKSSRLVTHIVTLVAR